MVTRVSLRKSVHSLKVLDRNDWILSEIRHGRDSQRDSARNGRDSQKECAPATATYSPSNRCTRQRERANAWTPVTFRLILTRTYITRKGNEPSVEPTIPNGVGECDELKFAAILTAGVGVGKVSCTWEGFANFSQMPAPSPRVGVPCCYRIVQHDSCSLLKCTVEGNRRNGTVCRLQLSETN
jgi:hypothetical protein